MTKTELILLRIAKTITLFGLLMVCYYFTVLSSNKEPEIAATTTIEPTQNYALAIGGHNLDVLEFSPVGDKSKLCVLVELSSRVAIDCFPNKSIQNRSD